MRAQEEAYKYKIKCLNESNEEMMKVKINESKLGYEKQLDESAKAISSLEFDVSKSQALVLDLKRESQDALNKSEQKWSERLKTEIKQITESYEAKLSSLTLQLQKLKENVPEAEELKQYKRKAQAVVKKTQKETQEKLRQQEEMFREKLNSLTESHSGDEDAKLAAMKEDYEKLLDEKCQAISSLYEKIGAKEQVVREFKERLEKANELSSKSEQKWKDQLKAEVKSVVDKYEHQLSHQATQLRKLKAKERRFPSSTNADLESGHLLETPESTAKQKKNGWKLSHRYQLFLIIYVAFIHMVILKLIFAPTN